MAMLTLSLAMAGGGVTLPARTTIAIGPLPSLTSAIITSSVHDMTIRVLPSHNLAALVRSPVSILRTSSILHTTTVYDAATTIASLPLTAVSITCHLTTLWLSRGTLTISHHILERTSRSRTRRRHWVPSRLPITAAHTAWRRRPYNRQLPRSCSRTIDRASPCCGLRTIGSHIRARSHTYGDRGTRRTRLDGRLRLRTWTW